MGDITASDGYVYKKEDLLQKMTAVMSNKADLNVITRTYGLRKRMDELLQVEELRRKLDKKYAG
ncbi:MAG: hypothetical protein V1707_03085 [bacterium]